MKLNSWPSMPFLSALVMFLLMLSFSSCGFFEEKISEEPLARVKDKYLFNSDIANLIGDRITKEDSATVVSNYIQSWINEMLLLDKAELNLRDEQKNFQKQLENYRNSLLIYAYEKKIIQQKLDTAVQLAEIEDYYFTNQQNFMLKQDLLKVVYARISNNAPQLSKIRKIYPSKKDEDHADFLDYCHQFAISFFEDDKWILLEDLLQNIPLKNDNPLGYIKSHQHFELQDSTSIYFVKIVAIKLKGSPSPLSFENQRIKSIIINQRKLSLLKKMKIDILNKAMAKKDFEIYE